MISVRTPRDVALRHRYTSDDVRGSEVSLGCFLENHLVQREIGDRPTKPGVLRLEFLEPLHLVDSHPAVFLPPAVVGYLMDAKLADNLGEPSSLDPTGFPPLVAWR